MKHTLFAVCLAGTTVGGAPVAADPNPGAYLAARQASMAHDYLTGARYLAESLLADPDNIALQEATVGALLSLGQFERAQPAARALADAGQTNPVAYLALSVAEAEAGNWRAILAALDAGRSAGPLVDTLLRAWASFGAGDFNQAMQDFDAAVASDGLAVYALTHKAYALAAVGDFEGAAAIFRSNPGLRFSRQSVIAYAQILSQLGDNEAALAFMDRVFGNALDPGLAQLQGALQAGDAVAYDAVRTPTQGVSDLYLTVAGILDGDAPDDFTLLYARAAAHLWPENAQAILTVAGLLENLSQYELANEAYSQVAPGDPAFLAAELGRAEVLASAGRPDAAIEVLEALSRSYPDRPEVWASKGDDLRQAERFDAAKDAYSKAIDLYPDDSPAKWFVYYTRGISNHKLDNWPAAEADFRAALVLRPDQPQVLNYLGYSLVERSEKLDEALGMIEIAAAARPDNGAIVDSLGWVYFQLGRYEEAAVQLERAASLEPLDPVINDHLGDALWAVGREIEAAFQWQRALSFDPQDKDAARIRDKLARGLDQVLIDEGAEPIRVASDAD